MTLKGRKAWDTYGGMLFEGTITEHDTQPFPSCKIVNTLGEYRYCHPDSIALTLEEAITQCEEHAEYWQGKANQLQQQYEAQYPFHTD